MRIRLLSCMTLVALSCARDVERKLEANERRLAKLERQLATTRQSTTRHADQISALEEQLASVDETTGTHSRKIKRIDDQVSGLESAVRSRGGEIGRLRQEVRELSRSVRERQSEALFVWDAADRFLGRVIEDDSEGVLFTMQGVTVPLFTEHLATDLFALYFTEPNCSGVPVAMAESTGGLLGFFRQSTAEVYLPTGRFGRRRVASAAHLVPRGGCIPVEGIYEVEELEVGFVIEPFSPRVRIHGMER